MGGEKIDPISIAREYFPDKNEEWLNFAIWERTGYPCFWNIPEDGSTPEECLRKQLRDFQKEVYNHCTCGDDADPVPCCGGCICVACGKPYREDL